MVLNLVDLIFAGFVLYFVYTNKGFVETMLEATGFLISLVLSYKYYAYASNFILEHFSVSSGIANGLGFFISLTAIEFIVFLIIALILSRFLKGITQTGVNKILGYFAGILQGVVIFVFLVNVIFALPVKGQVKKAILDSFTGQHIVNYSQSLQLAVKQVLNDTLIETLNFLTIKPKSDEQLTLQMQVPRKDLKADEDSERAMVALVNEEREKKGLPTLQVDTTMRDVARAYATDMMEHGFFSHTSALDGSSPADRAEKGNVEFAILGENLAYAPDIYIAHQGLMNSDGHRANILSLEYGRVGIGVIDGGVYGKMFVQEFAD